MTRSVRPVRVMYVVPDLGPGGAERHVTTLMLRLDPARFTCSVVCIGAERGLFGDLVAAGIPAVALRRTKRQALAALAGLVREMRRRRPDVVVVLGYNAEMLGRIAAIIAGVPHRVVWVHNCGDLGGDMRVRRLADRLLDRHTDAYFGVARAQARYLVEDLGYPAHKIRIIHNGIDPTGYRPADEQRARALLGIDPQRPVVGIVGWLRPEKDHVLLLQAARRLVDEFPDLTVLVVGDDPPHARGAGSHQLVGPVRRRIEHAAAELGLADHVMLVGVRSDVPDILPALTVFTLCSYTVECFPMALLEAMASGRPAVCTDVGGVGEMLADGITGYLVPPHDPAALADRLAKLLHDRQLCQRMGAAARDRVQREFGLDASADAAARELTAVAGVAPPSGGRRGGLPNRGPGGGPIRLTVVLDLTGVGGVEMLLLNLFRHFDPAVVRPRLVCLREAGPLADDFRAAGFEVETLDRAGRFDLRTLPRLVASLRADRTDAVLVPHHHQASLALGRLAAMIARVPVNIVAAHGMDLTSVGSRVLPRWAVRTLGVSDALVLLTESQGEYLRSQEGVGHHVWESVREVVIPNGIVVPESPGLAERARARAELGVTADDVVVGVVGRLHPSKAHHVLFEAVARCLPDVPSLRLVVIGDGELGPRLHRSAEQLGIGHRTTFLGTRSDVPVLLPGLDVSCLSSEWEAVPIALIEAMAVGVPIVATNCGAVRDIVSDGEQGYLVPVGDVDRFADRLRLLAGDPDLRARLGKAARIRAEREFDIERTARAYEELLTELVVRA
jgi:glycosyltransferase involved in cell wall biosynthesis